METAKEQILEKYKGMSGTPFMYAEDYSTDVFFIAKDTVYWYTGFKETESGVFHIFCRQPLTSEEAIRRSQMFYHAPPFAQYFDKDGRINRKMYPAEPKQQTNPFVYYIVPHDDEYNLFEGLIQIR